MSMPEFGSKQNVTALSRSSPCSVRKPGSRMPAWHPSIRIGAPTSGTTGDLAAEDRSWLVAGADGPRVSRHGTHGCFLAGPAGRGRSGCLGPDADPRESIPRFRPVRCPATEDFVPQHGQGQDHADLGTCRSSFGRHHGWTDVARRCCTESAAK